MDVEEFQRILKIGLGRAILHLQKHDAAPYRDVILDACLHNAVYDRQVEGGNGRYIMDIIELTGEQKFYRKQILDAASAINDNADDRDASHLLDMVQQFAEQGDKEARQIIYDVISTLTPENPWDAWRIIELDKIEGFLFIADNLGEFAISGAKFYETDYLLWSLEDDVGEAEATKTLTEARQDNERIDAYLKVVEKYRADREQHGKASQSRKSKPTNLTYSEITKQIESPGWGGMLNTWGKTADPESLKLVANDLLQEEDPDKLRKYLTIFRRTPFPLNPEPLFKLIDYRDNRHPTLSIQVPAKMFTVLENINHPSVRDFALRLFADKQWYGRAIGLLKSNFEDGDWSFIEEMTQRTFDNDFIHHNLEMSVRKVFDEHPSQAAAGALLNLYEYAPCSFCRRTIVKQLHSIDALTDSIREECLYDSNLEIRELAQRNFEPEEKGE